MYYNEINRLPRSERMQKTEDEILKIIKDFVVKHRYSPSVREIVKYSSVRSSSTVTMYLNKLKEKGLIEWETNRPRTIKILLNEKKE